MKKKEQKRRMGRRGLIVGGSGPPVIGAPDGMAGFSWLCVRCIARLPAA